MSRSIYPNTHPFKHPKLHSSIAKAVPYTLSVMILKLWLASILCNDDDFKKMPNQIPGSCHSCLARASPCSFDRPKINQDSENLRCLVFGLWSASVFGVRYSILVFKRPNGIILKGSQVSLNQRVFIWRLACGILRLLSFRVKRT